MPVRSLPHSNDPTHLLRALLRECTYLPDPASRPILTRSVLSRFREYHPPRDAHETAAKEKKKSKYPPSPERKAKITTAARRALSLLIRANQGDVKPLLKVLLFTYGRQGKRRRELISDLASRPDVARDDEHDVGGGRASWRAPRLDRDVNLEAWPAMPGRLAALIRSQADQELPHLSRTVLKTDKPRIPKHNAWMRPLPKRRVKNLQWDFYSKTLDRVMPPLPEEEWARLRDLANGTQKWDGPVPRRKRPDDDDDDERRTSLLDERIFGAPLDKQRYRLTDSEPHHLTARFMRRLWQKVFTQCPRIRWGGQGKGWEVEWGMNTLNRRRFRTANMDEVMSLFGETEDESTVDHPRSRQYKDDSNDLESSVLNVEPQDGRPRLQPSSSIV